MKNEINFLRAKDSNEHISEKDIKMDNMHEKKMLSITSHWGNVNQNHNETPFHSHWVWL